MAKQDEIIVELYLDEGATMKEVAKYITDLLNRALSKVEIKKVKVVSTEFSEPMDDVDIYLATIVGPAMLLRKIENAL